MKIKEFINNWLSAWTGNNPGELLRYYADEVFYLDPANPDGIRGKESLSVYFSKLLSKNPDWIWEAEEIIPTEKGCTLKWKAQIPVGKEQLVLFGLDIVEVTAGKITRNEVYFDRSLWKEVLQRQVNI